MKKLVALLLVAIMAMSVVATACADALSICSADNTFGLSTDPALQQAVVDMLEEACNVELEAIIPPISSYNDKLETMMAGGDVPDIFSISHAMTRLPNYVAREQPLKLNDLIAGSAALSAIDQSHFNALAINDGIYAIPDFSALPYQPTAEMKAALELQRSLIDKAMELRGDKQMIPAGKSDLYDENAASITSYWKEVTSQIVLGSVTVEEGLNNYKNFWNSVDGDTILKELNK